jgi:WD40 repeat protein
VTVPASGGGDGTVRLWNLATGRPVDASHHASAKYGVHAVAFSPDGTLLASADGDGTVRLWNLATGRPVATLQTGTGPRRAVPSGFAFGGPPDHGRLVRTFSPGGALITSCWSASPSVVRR